MGHKCRGRVCGPLSGQRDSVAGMREVIIIAYVIGALFEVLGIVLTVNVIIEDRHNGTVVIDHPHGWRKWRGPAVIGFGIVIGLAGNIASLWVNSQ